jgi:hypothetical protein
MSRNGLRSLRTTVAVGEGRPAAPVPGAAPRALHASTSAPAGSQPPPPLCLALHASTRRSQQEIPRALQPLAAHLNLLYDLKRAARYHLLNCRALLVRFVAVFELLTEVPALRPALADATAARRLLLAAGVREEDFSGENALDPAGASPGGPRPGRGGGSVGLMLATQLEDLASDAHDLFAQFSEQ